VQLELHALETGHYEMEQAPVPWPYYELNLGQRQNQLSPQTRNETLFDNLPAPIHQLTQTPIPATTENRIWYSEGQAIDPPCQDNGRKRIKRTFQVSGPCRVHHWY